MRGFGIAALRQRTTSEAWPSRNRLGDAYRDLGRTSEAVHEYSVALADLSRLDNSPAVLHCRVVTRRNLGEILLSSASTDARSHLEESRIDSQRLLQFLPDEHPLRESALHNLQVIILRQPRCDFHA